MVTDSPWAFGLVVVIILLIASWPVATWWNTPADHTFKRVLQSIFKDIAEIAAPSTTAIFSAVLGVWRFVSGNMPGLAAALLAAYASLSPELREIMAHDWRVPAVLFALAFVVNFSGNRQSKVVAPQTVLELPYITDVNALRAFVTATVQEAQARGRLA